MNIKSRAMEMGLLKALVAAVCIGSVARAGMSYLPLTGPPALRMQVVRTPKPTPVAMIDTSRPAKANLTTNGDTCVDTNAVATEGNGSYMGRMPAISIGAGNPLDAGPGAAIFALPAQNLSGMTPEMLATYFTPTTTGTNGAETAAPFRVEFIPPVLQPDKSSHAEYIVK
jgi:hypothetical protein